MSDSRLGFVTQTHTGDVTVPESITAAADAGFDFVEWYMDGASELATVDEDAVEALLERHDVDLLVHLPFGSIDLGTPRDRVREAAVEELRTRIEASSDFGAEKAVVHPSSAASPPEWSIETVRPTVVESLRELDAAAADAGVELCAENLPGGIYTVHEFDELLAETDVSMTFDTGHARVDGMDEAGMSSFLTTHRDRVSHVHVNDARAAADEHVPTGSGTTDFGTALAPLLDGWEGTFSLEVYTLDLDYVAWSMEKFEAATERT